MTHLVSPYLDAKSQQSYSESSKQGKHDIDKLYNKCRVSTKKGLLCPNLGKYNLGECARFCKKHFAESLRRIIIVACSDEFQIGFDDHHTETFRPRTCAASVEFNLKDRPGVAYTASERGHVVLRANVHNQQVYSVQMYIGEKINSDTYLIRYILSLQRNMTLSMKQ